MREEFHFETIIWNSLILYSKLQFAYTTSNYKFEFSQVYILIMNGIS